MKYICLGYMEPGKFEGMTEDEQHAMFDECFDRRDSVLEKRQSRDDRRPLCGNQGTARRPSHP